MKTYCVVYKYTTSSDQTVQAKNEKEAVKKFREFFPDETITGVWEVTGHEQAGSDA